MKRLVQPELLDQLPPDDPQALRSRKDLRLINALMRNHVTVARLLREYDQQQMIGNIVELGAGDGNFLLRTLQKCPVPSQCREVTLLDFKNNIGEETLRDFRKINYNPTVLVTDVFDWPEIKADLVIANLFLHHFKEEKLRQLFVLIAQRAKCFIAIEPRRGLWPLFGSKMLGAIGCNSVTRHDAVISVQAGFRNAELSDLWPSKQEWNLTEKFCAPFSHLFVARHIE